MDKRISRRSFLVGGTSALVAGGLAFTMGPKKIALADNHTMKQGKWIWLDIGKIDIDSYGEFYSEFNVSKGSGSVVLDLACDGIYAVFINDKLTNFAQCSDYPDYKFYDKFDISEYCNDGLNNIKIQVWFAPGKEISTYKDTNTPGVIFEISQASSILAYSSVNTLSRVMNEYVAGRCEKITLQMGFNYWYKLNETPQEYSPKSKTSPITPILHEREILPLALKDPVEATFMHTVTPSAQRHKDMIGYVFKLPQETVGFLEFEIDCNIAKKNDGTQGVETLTFAWGEHIVDNNQPRYIIDDRTFCVYVDCINGTNKYINPFRRMGGKYIEVICNRNVIKGGEKGIKKLNIRPVEYPFQVRPYKAKNKELQDIYDACILTLRCSLHEHYEDCPWREQALYGMDSRNQMLCGYHAFLGHEFQRHNLKILAHSLRDDGMLDICAPCSTNRPIPFFSLCFVLAVYEYLQYTKDKSILKHVEFAVDSILKTCASKYDKNIGVLHTWPDPFFWNFYEWADCSDGSDKAEAHLIMNAMYVYVHDLWAKVSGKTYIDTKALLDSTAKYFLKDGKYILHSQTSMDSQLGNAVLLLAGLEDETLQQKLAEDLKASQTMSGSMVKATLSMKAFVYDALVKKNSSGTSYAEVVEKDILYCYQKMMNDETFTGTFWETEEGQSAFSNAGSLCHGWSAIPAYYIPKFFS